MQSMDQNLQLIHESGPPLKICMHLNQLPPTQLDNMLIPRTRTLTLNPTPLDHSPLPCTLLSTWLAEKPLQHIWTKSGYRAHQVVYSLTVLNFRLTY